MIERILLAEDNAMNLKLLLYGLKGYQVDVASNGREAIEMFKAASYDMILMDIYMPQVDGITASKEIRRIESENKKKTGAVILGMTACWVEDILDECEKAGVNGFLPKPFKPSELPQLITELYSECLTNRRGVSLPEA